MTTAEQQDLELHLGSRIREAYENATDIDPRAVAEDVIQDLPEDLLRDALRLTLPGKIRQYYQTIRKGHRLPPTSSPRWDAVREQAEHLAVFRQPTAIGPGQWLPLGELTCAQVLMAANLRQDNAERAMAQARRYADLHAAMRKKRAKVVSDLTPESVEAILHD